MKRQEAEDEEELERALCKDKGAGEWFRLEQGDDKCRDVIQCTASVSFIQFIFKFLRSNIGALAAKRPSDFKNTLSNPTIEKRNFTEITTGAVFCTA